MITTKLTWNLQKVMQSRGCSIPKLAAGLNALGHKISEAHVARIASQAPKRVDFVLISKLCEILDCETTDLLTVNNRPDTYFDGQIDDFVCHKEGCSLEIRIDNSAGDAFSFIFVRSWQNTTIPVAKLAKVFQEDRNSFTVTLLNTIGKDSIQLSNNHLIAENPCIDISTAGLGFVSLLFLKKRSRLSTINSVHGYALLGLLNQFAPKGLKKFSETPWIPIEDIYTLFGQNRDMYPGNLNRFVIQKAVLAINNANLGFQVAAEKQVAHKKIKYFRFVGE